MHANSYYFFIERKLDNRGVEIVIDYLKTNVIVDTLNLRCKK